MKYQKYKYRLRLLCISVFLFTFVKSTKIASFGAKTIEFAL